MIYVAEKIKESKPGDDESLYTLIHILGRSGATQYRELVEHFLYYPSDPMISGMALTTLFRYWGNDAQRYLYEIKAFIKGVSWDKSNDLRLAAMQCVGDFLKKNPEKELFQLVLDLYETSNTIVVQAGRERTCERADAKFWLEVSFHALARAVGKNSNDLFGRPDEPVTPFSEEFILEVSMKAKQIIKTLK